MEKESNFVSAVLYLHNAEETARGFLECVCGVLARHFLKYEVVCVNDASDDRTAAEVREFAAEHPGAPVTILHMSYFQGRELAMNAGMDLAIGDFVFEFDVPVCDFDPELIFGVRFMPGATCRLFQTPVCQMVHHPAPMESVLREGLVLQNRIAGAAGFAACIAVVLSILRAQSAASAAGQRALHLSQMEMRLPLTLVLMGGMLCAAHMPRLLQKLLDNRLMRFLSAISMNLYIWHQILSVQMRMAWFPDADVLHITPVQQRAYSLLCFSVSILVAMAATYGLEQPAARAVNAWIKRLGRKRNHEGPQTGNPSPTVDSLLVRHEAGRARAHRELWRRAGGGDRADP